MNTLSFIYLFQILSFNLNFIFYLNFIYEYIILNLKHLSILNKLKFKIIVIILVNLNLNLFFIYFKSLTYHISIKMMSILI